MAWSLSFIIYALVLTFRRQWASVKQQPMIWLIGSLGICGAHTMLVAGLRVAPPEQIATMSAIWPLMVVLLAKELFYGQQIRWLSVLGVILGFIGVCLVITEGQFFSGFKFAYLPGYLFALLSSFLWSIYTLMTRRFYNITSLMMGMYLGVGAVIALGYHLMTEQFMVPTAREGLLLALKGGFTLAFSYFCWDFAIKRGHFTLLNALAYFNPILSICLLILFGISVAALPLFAGTFLVVIGSVLCGLPKRSPPR